MHQRNLLARIENAERVADATLGQMFSGGCICFPRNDPPWFGWPIEVPFQGNSTRTISFKVLNRDPVPATALNSELCPELGHVIARAIAKDPSQRYQTGKEMARDVQDLRRSILPPSSDGTPLVDRGRDLLFACVSYRQIIHMTNLEASEGVLPRAARRS